jgi:hypothetical protein
VADIILPSGGNCGRIDEKIDAPGVSPLIDIVELLKEGPDEIDFDVFFFRVTPTATPIAMLISTRNARMPITIAPFLDLQNDAGGDVSLGPYVSSLPWASWLGGLYGAVTREDLFKRSIS